MKKTSLLLAFSAISFAASAQLTLTGTSYTQNFDGLGGGLPTGWTVFTGATATSLGTIKSLTTAPGLPFHIVPDTSACAGLVVGGGFKNYPSATVINQGVNFCPAGSTTVSATYTNRALGVRQVGQTNSTFPNSEPGAAFALQLANTTNLKNFTLSFKLQSLDTSSPRTTTWTVDYGIGATPTTFTAVSPTGTMTTGNKLFSNNTVTASFGTALDNKSTPVWIRIVALSATTGSGNRATTAIDDFTLTYNNTTGVNDMANEAGLYLAVAGAATSERIVLNYSTEVSETFDLGIYDLSGRIVYRTSVDAKAGYSQLTVSGLSLAPGMYIAKMSNGNSSATAKVIVQ